MMDFLKQNLNKPKNILTNVPLPIIASICIKWMLVLYPYTLFNLKIIRISHPISIVVFPIYFIVVNSGYQSMSAVGTEIVEKEKIVKTFNDTNYFAPGTYKRDFLQLFSTSALANFFTKTVLAPLERWRIIKQTQPAYELRPSKFAYFTSYFSKVWKDQGVSAFWRGNATNCWLHFWQVLSQVVILDSINATFYEFAFEMQNQPLLKTLILRVGSPLVAAATVLAITHPIDTARIRISMNYFRNPKEMLFTGITSCWSLIRLQERSTRGLYRGYLLATFISLLHLNLYVTFRDVWNSFRLSDDNSVLSLLASKEAAGSMFALLLLHPLDTIKKNLQLNNQSKPVMFYNAREVVKYYSNEKKILQLYQGLSVSLVRQALFCPIFALSLNFMEKQLAFF